MPDGAGAHPAPVPRPRVAAARAPALSDDLHTGGDVRRSRAKVLVDAIAKAAPKVALDPRCQPGLSGQRFAANGGHPQRIGERICAQPKRCRTGAPPPPGQCLCLQPHRRRPRPARPYVC